MQAFRLVAVGTLIPAPIRELFARMDAVGISYVVLRRYVPLDELAESLDIDVYIARRDRQRATDMLARAGWLARRYQTGRYPRRFHDSFDVPGRVCTMLDVVYGPYYGDRLHGPAGAEHVLATAESLEGVRVPHPWAALVQGEFGAAARALAERLGRSVGGGHPLNVEEVRREALRPECSAALRRLYGHSPATTASPP